MNERREHCYLLGQRVDITSYDAATRHVLEWARARESRYVCAANVHMVMEGYDTHSFREIVNAADLVTPDGMPLVWACRAFGAQNAARVYGPTLFLHICAQAAKAAIPIGLYGSTTENLERLRTVLKEIYPGIQIACTVAPPFRAPTTEEDLADIRTIEESAARILFVGLGCPKQERWMAAHKGTVNMPMIGVGAAFDFCTGKVKQAPPWMQRLGLEWLFRLMMEPGRLWKRYAWHNPRFIVLFCKQYIQDRVQTKK